MPDSNEDPQIRRVRQYFFIKHGINLSETEVYLCLESLADLFLAFADVKGSDPAGLLKKIDGQSSPTLLTTEFRSGASDSNNLKL